MIDPLNEIVTAPLSFTYFPVNVSVPRAPAKVDVPRVTVAVPENETRLALVAQAWAPRTASLTDPGRPLRTIVPVKTTHVSLVTAPLAEPRNVLAPISLPRPVAVAVPEAVVLLLVPVAWPA